MAVGSFRYSVFDPWMLVGQMVCLQSAFYFSLGLWVFVVDTMSGHNHSLDHIFKYEAMALGHTQGKILAAAFLCNALTCSLFLWYVVQRTKLCLDFTCTVFMFHLLISMMYNGLAFPPFFSFYALNVLGIGIMCVTGEFLCMRTELKDIPVTMAGSSSESNLITAS